ncbi:MAG: glycosyltransferase family 1 protein [Gammaproteobacteria bacterium]|nr:glycosyltransferase family 1 protein [Gammaproteobacteria bacterium]
MRLVYLSPVPWVSFDQRPHKFIKWFHSRTGGEVLWIDPYPTRFPLLSDFRRFGSKVEQQQFVSAPWLRVIQPSALPIEPLPVSGWLNAIIWKKIFNGLISFATPCPTLLVIGKPSAMALVAVKRLSGCHSFYDAMDDFSAFYSGLSRVAMRNREIKLVNSVSTVLASSTHLKQRWKEIKLDVRLVHNGLDMSTTQPRIARRIPRGINVLGYVGTIATWFDWDWVIRLAKLRPKDVIRLIGPDYIPVPMKLPPNIEMLPPCDHRAALLAMQDFDVGLIPFKKNSLTKSVDPIKYYEYRALGLPVISTNFGEMTFRAGEEGVFLSVETQDLNNIVENALDYQARMESIVQFVAHNSWDSRFDGAGII